MNENMFLSVLLNFTKAGSCIALSVQFFTINTKLPMLASKDYTALDSSVEPVFIRSSATGSNFLFAAVKTFDAKLAGLCECENSTANWILNHSAREILGLYTSVNSTT